MKTGWWIVIGIVVVAAIIFAIMKSKQNKVTTNVGGVSLEGTPCNLTNTLRSVGDTVVLPTIPQGVIKNGVCVAA